MTQDLYYEMCEMLGSEPIAEEIPILLTDLPLDVQEAYRIYSKLQDSWDYMNGIYIGKNYSGFFELLEIHGIEDKRTIADIILLIDYIRKDVISSSKPKTPSSK